MNLQAKITEALKEAMKAKDAVALESLRAIKSAILLAKTEAGASEELTGNQEIKLLQKLVKQRQDSASLYKGQGREDLAQTELNQLAVIEKFLPKQLTEQEVESEISKLIQETNIREMGGLIKLSAEKLAGKTDTKTISAIVKKLLS